MRSRSVLAFLFAGVIALALVACGGNEEAKEASPKKETEKVEKKIEDTRQILGKESDDSTEIALTNGLDGKIVFFATRVSGEEKYSNNLMAKDGTIAKSEEVRLFVEKANKEGTSYDVVVKLDGSDDEIEFVEVPLVDVASVELLQGDGVSYVDYIDAKGKKGSTKEAALERKQAKEKEEAEAKAAAEAEAQQQDESQSAAQEYSEPAYTEPASEPVAEAPSAPAAPEPAPAPAPAAEPVSTPVETPSAPAQSEDACVDDVVLRD